MSALPGPGLYVITPPEVADAERLLALVDAAIAGGARVVQYRDKGTDGPRRLAQATALADLCRARDTCLIVNDDVALARASGADGVHVGREDAGVAEARAALGPRALVGATCHDSLALAIQARRAGADYVAFGSFFASPTKPHAVRAPVTLLAEARARLTLPIVAIGGITPENGAALVAAGASHLAVVSGVLGAADPSTAARRYAELFDTTRAA